jgi:hypothetical protein
MFPQIARDQPRADIGRGTGAARDQQLHRLALEEGFFGLRVRARRADQDKDEAREQS